MVTVIGQGYVGLPLVMLAVEAGHSVVGIDHDVARVEQLRRGGSYVDDVEASRLQAALESGRYRATSDYSGASGFEAAVITVPNHCAIARRTCRSSRALRANSPRMSQSAVW